MSFLSYVLLGVSLSMDAFAISVSYGISLPDMRRKQAVVIALYFGGFQAGMTFLGWLLGSTVSAYISAVDHWVAFGLLAFIGTKMIVDAVKAGKEEPKPTVLSHKLLATMAVATSIDALAVGISLAIVAASIGAGSAVIGVTTFLISFAGAVFGKRLGVAFGSKATMIGGAVLILIGVKILVEHLAA